MDMTIRTAYVFLGRMLSWEYMYDGDMKRIKYAAESPIS